MIVLLSVPTSLTVLPSTIIRELRLKDKMWVEITIKVKGRDLGRDRKFAAKNETSKRKTPGKTYRKDNCNYFQVYILFGFDF